MAELIVPRQNEFLDFTCEALIGIRQVSPVVERLADLRRAFAPLPESNRFQPTQPVVRVRNMRFHVKKQVSWFNMFLVQCLLIPFSRFKQHQESHITRLSSADRPFPSSQVAAIRISGRCGCAGALLI